MLNVPDLPSSTWQPPGPVRYSEPAAHAGILPLISSSTGPLCSVRPSNWRERRGQHGCHRLELATGIQGSGNSGCQLTPASFGHSLYALLSRFLRSSWASAASLSAPLLLVGSIPVGSGPLRAALLDLCVAIAASPIATGRPTQMAPRRSQRPLIIGERDWNSVGEINMAIGCCVREGRENISCRGPLLPRIS